MKSSQSAPKDLDEYIAEFPANVREALESIRQTIRLAAPEAHEAIKYQMPTFVLHGNLIHFAAYKKHIGLYPAPRSDAEFEEELSAYAGEKSTVRFPLAQPMPLDLISRIVKHRVEQNLLKASSAQTR